MCRVCAIPIYQEANTYPHLLEDYISSNVKDQKLKELRQGGWTIAEPYFLKAQRDAVDYYGNLTEIDKGSTDLKRRFLLLVMIGLVSWLLRWVCSVETPLT